MTSIQNIQNIGLNPELGKKLETKGVEGQKSFADTISDFVSTVNQQKIDASEAIADVITGKSDNLQEAMVRTEESKLSFQLMLEIRNKLLDSFREIQRMQV